MHFLNLQRLFYEFYLFLTGGAGVGGLVVYIKSLIASIAPFSTIISLLFLTGIVYSLIRFYQIRKEEKIEIYERSAPFAEIKEEGLASTEEFVGAENKRWRHIEELMNSSSMNDWRQAILNADIMLDELLSKMGYTGADLGTKLKQVDKRKFNTLNSAWEAHKVRNLIAHEGENFILTPRRTKDTIRLYKQVFDEFGYI